MIIYEDPLDSLLVRYRYRKRRPLRRNRYVGSIADDNPAASLTGMNNASKEVGQPNLSSLDAWGYVFHVSSQSIAVGAPLNFSNNGPLMGINHEPGTSNIQVAAAGTYSISFGIYTAQNNPQDWAVVVNGMVRSRFNSAGQTIHGTTLLTLNANDGVTIRNVNTLPSPATLRQGPFTTAYVLIMKVD